MADRKEPKMNLKRALADRWSVRVWPHYNGYSVVFTKAGEDERLGRGSTLKRAVKAAFRGYRLWEPWVWWQQPTALVRWSASWLASGTCLGRRVTDLADLAFDVAGDLPAQVRKVIDTAVTNGWELNKPGMTLALRLNHPTDELAQPVYILWAVGKTPTGRMSFKFVSCGTAGLVPLTGPDLLEYLADPTVIYKTDEDIEQEWEP
jgi:hypothetical protein